MVRTIFIMPKIAKNLPYNLHGWAFFNQQSLPITYYDFITKVWSDPKVNPQIHKDLNP